MNVIPLNTIALDGGKAIIKKGGSSGGGGNSGGGGGTTPSRPKWTGHADAEGLKAIGWTDEDIAYYQQNGVNWNEEDDHLHLVPDDNKALYGVLTANNIPSYKDKIVYLPKIDTSAVTSMSQYFSDCSYLISIPILDFSNVTTFFRLFHQCYSLVCLPPIYAPKVTSINEMFSSCQNLRVIASLDFAKSISGASLFKTCAALKSVTIEDSTPITSMKQMFYGCSRLAQLKMNKSQVTTMEEAFYSCRVLQDLHFEDVAPSSFYDAVEGAYLLNSVHIDIITSIPNFSRTNYNLKHIFAKNLNKNLSITPVIHLSKESLLYIINNEVATSAITITLNSYAYTRLSNDADIVAALAAHPNISISQ